MGLFFVVLPEVCVLSTAGARRETVEAEARKQYRRSVPVAERPQITGGSRSHQDALRKKQKETNISPAIKALQMKVNKTVLY